MKLSVITINFNNRLGLIETIKSVLGQTCKEFEYIVIDGGSTDGSVEVIKDSANHINYWVSEADHGVYHAMNKGIAVATGDYCIFMNSGDIFHDNEVIKKSFPYLDGTDVVYGNTLFSNGETRLSLEKITFKNLYAGSLSHQSTYIRTKYLKQYKYDESLKIVSDWKFFLQVLILNNGSYKGVDFFVSTFDANGLTNSNMDLFRSERKQVIEQLFPPRILEDMSSFIYGDTWEDKLYIEIKHSRFHDFIYSCNVLFIRFLTFFRRKSNWIQKYPIKIAK